MVFYPTSRRNLLLAGAACLAPAQELQRTLTAAQVIDRIKSNIGIPWRDQTVDRVIAGDPNTAVKGIATTMMATLDVMQRAALRGADVM